MYTLCLYNVYTNTYVYMISYAEPCSMQISQGPLSPGKFGLWANGMEASLLTWT